MYKYILSIFIIFLYNSCNKITDFEANPSYDQSYLAGTTKLNLSMRSYLEGIFSSSNNTIGLGNRFVFKWRQDRLSIFSNKDGIYCVLDVGVDYSDSSIKMAGFWRSPLIDGEGNLYLKLTKENGASEILRNIAASPSWEGTVVNPDRDRGDISLNFERKFSAKVLNSNFTILAHRAGGRNSDNLPYCENSLNLVKYAGSMGATGVEIDVKLSQDNVPLIYHDADLNTRLLKKSPAIGFIEDFDYDFLSQICQLRDGQKIPSLEEMLDVIIDSTDMKIVWLDNKGGNERFFNYTMPIVTKAINKAKSKNKQIFIINGIPTEEVAAEFTKSNNYKSRPSLCEISLARTKELGSVIYAPRWTLGTLDAEVADAHANNIKVVSWTIDLNTVMRKYLQLGDFDGILTNYPSILAYEFYIQE